MLTRFAPSPTGYLHIGNMRTALNCYLLAQKLGGSMILRIDDTDVERSKQEYIDAIQQDLTWLGISWSRMEHQSKRFANYNAIVEKLKAAGRIYACYETAEELDIKRKMQLTRGQAPIYDRESLKLTDAEKKAKEAAGIRPHWRFKLEDKPIHWQDMIRGDITFEGRNISDPVIIRENGDYLYMLPSTVDDAEMAITHVLRGEDHITNTAIQIQMFEALGAAIPHFAHMSLIKTKEGKLSKREGSEGVAFLQEQGIEPMAVCSFLAKIGTSQPVELRTHMADLIAETDLAQFSKAPTQYDFNDVIRLNDQLIHTMDFTTAQAKLTTLGLKNVDESFWLAVRPNLHAIKDVKEWWHICKEPLTPIIDDKDFIAQVHALLPAGELTSESWSVWTNAVKEKTGRKGKELFMPIRKALTAQEHGPDLPVLLPLMGRTRVEQRLQGMAA